MNMDQVLFSLSGNSIISLAALIAAITAIVVLLRKAVHFIDSINATKKALEESNAAHTQEISELKAKHDEDVSGIKQEQTLIVYGVLCCLKGLSEKGCDGPVHEAIDKLEKYLNKTAHEV